MRPTIGRIVIYRSRTGDYDVPAIVTATTDTLNAKGVELGHVPALSSDEHVHLTVLSPGRPWLHRSAEVFKTESPYGRGENVSGCYQEWDIPWADTEDHDHAQGLYTPGTWRWPEHMGVTT